jgi:hypothetical protein
MGDLAHTDVVKRSFVHEAVLELDGNSDPDAPGAAITTRLCGSYDHTGPCPLAPHNIHRTGATGDIALRIVFATDPGQEHTVRGMIRDVLQSGQMIGPDGRTSSWRLVQHPRGTRRSAEQQLATRLAATD